MSPDIDQLSEQLRKTEEGLLASQDKVRTLVKVIPAGLLITTAAGRIEAANPQCLELFSCSYAYLLGKNLAELFDKSREKQLLNLLKETQSSIEVFAIRANSESFPAQIQVRPFAGGDIASQYLVFIEDVTQRYELDALKQDFISMITHDLRTPLTSVSTTIDLISEGVFGQLPQQVQNKLEVASMACDYMLGLVNDLLDLNKVEACGLSLDIAEMPVKPLLERAVETVQPLSGLKSIAISCVCDDVMIAADHSRLARVIVNLLANAIKFSPKSSTIYLSGRTEGDSFCFSVSDSGRGIAEADQERIFNKFAQLRATDATALKGSGLGLAISKTIVDAHHGSIGVSSEPGRGSTFWFKIPLRLENSALESGSS